MLRHGLASTLPPPREWTIAQIVYGDLSTAGRLNDSLFYGPGALAPERILHILQNAPSKAYVEYARARSLAIVYPRDLRPTCAFVAHRLILGYLPFALRGLWELFRDRASIDLVRATLRLGVWTMETEVLAMHHRSRVCVGWDTYSAFADVRAMVWDRLGRRYVGYMHATTPIPVYMYHDSYMPVLLCPGRAIADMYGETLKHVPEVIPVGLMTAELTLDRAEGAKAIRSASPGAHIVAAFDSSYSPFWGLTVEVYEEFFRSLVALADGHPDVMIYLRRKYDERNPGYEHCARRIESHPRIRVLYDEDSYRLLAAADSVIAIGVSTIGWEALACRKPTFFLDPRREFRSHRARRYAPALVCHTAEELLERFAALLGGHYMDGEAWDRICAYETGAAADRPLAAAKAVLLREAGLEGAAALEDVGPVSGGESVMQHHSS